MSVLLMSLREASQKSGINRGTLKHLAIQGKLPAVKVTRPDRATQQRYMVSDADLEAFMETYAPVEKKTWTDADKEAVAEMYRSRCHNAQIAELLGRTEASVALHISKMLRDGSIERIHARNNVIVPWRFPLTAIWLGRTCIHCGVFRDRKRFGTGTDGYLKSICNQCNWKKYPKTDRNRGRRAMQKLTLDRATRTGQEYTSDDIEKLMDVAKPSWQVALEIGRTLSGVDTKRQQLGAYRRTKNTDPEWSLRLPQSVQEAITTFQELGIPQPEDWDWND